MEAGNHELLECNDEQKKEEVLIVLSGCQVLNCKITQIVTFQFVNLCFISEKDGVERSVFFF